MNATKTHDVPRDGGSYRRLKDGSYEQLVAPTRPPVGKSRSRTRAPLRAVPDAPKPEARDAGKDASPKDAPKKP